MTNPSAQAQDLLRYYNYTFTWCNRQLCVAKLKEAISKSAGENLEYWEASELHIGDAGFHYPRIDFDIDSTPPPG